MNSDKKQYLTHTLPVIYTALANGLLTKEEVIDWAYHIIDQETQPDILIIDLALSGTKSLQDTFHYLGQADFEMLQGRPLLGLLYQQYASGNFNLAKTINTLYHLQRNTSLSGTEVSTIYNIDYFYDEHQEGYVALEELTQKTEQFLTIYQHYTIYNVHQWPELDKKIDEIQAATESP